MCNRLDAFALYQSRMPKRNLPRSLKLGLAMICVLCFAILSYHNRYLIQNMVTAQTNSFHRENQRFSVSPEGQKLQLQRFLTVTSSEQISLWKNITLPSEEYRPSFAIARHGDPLNLYHVGGALVDAPALQTYLTVNTLQQILLNVNTSKEINCLKIITGGEIEIEKGASMENHKIKNTHKNVANMSRTGSCERYIKDLKFVLSPITALEGNFPLAYSILIYTDLVLFQRLLRVIYRPQNMYCIHIDKKSPSTFSEATRNIASCFKNVFILTKSVDVRWGEFSVLEPELICMEELLKRHQKWKYFINLTGQEFPLRTNYEIVKILSSLNGSNLVEGTLKRANKDRWEAARPPPHGITPVKGAVHVILNREFVDFAINNEKAKDLLDWCKETKVPDETFFATLHYNPQLNAPGSYKGSPETDNKTNPFLARFKNWEDLQWPCKGKMVRGICVFGVGDLPLLASREELFANKFHEDYQPATLDCLEELLINRTKEESLGILQFNTTYYRTRHFVFNKV